MRTLSFLIWSGIFVSFCGSIFVGFFLLLNYIKFNEFDYILLFKVVFVFFIAGFVIPIPELIKLRNKKFSFFILLIIQLFSNSL